MIFDYTITENPPNLETFKQELIEDCLMRSFFQNVPRKNFNMLALPLIIAPSLLREQTNNDIKEMHGFD